MNKKSYISLLAAAIAITGCESDINNFMVDDSVWLLTPGLVEESVYSGLDSPCEIYVLKSGKGFQGATVSIEVDNTVLDDYNASAPKTVLSALPSDCYTLSADKITLDKGDYTKPFTITWNFDRLSQALASNPNQAIALRMPKPEGINYDESRFDANRLTTIIQPKIVTASVGLASSGLYTGLMPTRRSALVEKVYMNVTANFIPANDIDYTISVEPALLDEYNQANGTDYKLLPSEAYELSASSWTLKKSMNTSRFSFKFYREALIPENGPSHFGEYILPLRLSGLSSSLVNAGKDYVLYRVSVVASEIDKAKWSVLSCNSDVRTITNWDKVEGDYIPDYLIDGTSNKYWRSIWSETQTLPYEIVLDLGTVRDLYRLGIESPASSHRKYFNSKAGRVETAESPEGPWTHNSAWTYPSKTSASAVFDLQPVSTQYIKIIIDESFDGGYKMAIGELNLWGE